MSSRKEGGVTFQQITTCDACHGRGTVVETPCSACAGRGEVEREETLVVKIPAGVEEGTALRIPGRGGPSHVEGAAPGDLYVVVYSAHDPRFERRGANLWRAETIEMVDAVLGTQLETPTLDGPVTTDIPPGTQPETVLRLRGKGLPEFGGRRRGDLFLTIHVHIPEKLSKEQRQLFHQLRSARRATAR